MGVVQNSIDIQKIIEAGGDPTIAAKVQELEAEIGDENSGIIKDIDDLQEANALIMTSVSTIKTTADSAKARADQAVLWSERKDYVGKNLLPNTMTSGSGQDVTFTVNSDGTISLSGIASANVDRPIYDTRDSGVRWEGKTLVLKRGITGNGVTLYVNAYNGTTFVRTLLELKDATEGTELTFDYDGYDRVRITLYVYKDIDTAGLVVKPMLIYPSVSDVTYEKFLPDNTDLLQTATLKSVTAAAADFAAFQTAIAAL